MSPTAFAALQRQVVEKLELAERRRAEKFAQRPAWAATAARLGKHQADLQAADEALVAAEEKYAAAVAAAGNRHAAALLLVQEDEDAVRHLQISAPDWLLGELQKFDRRLVRAAEYANSPDLVPPTILRGLEASSDEYRNFSIPPNCTFGDVAEAREKFHRLVAEHGERRDACRAYMDVVQPIVEQLRELALEADPTESAMNEIFDAVDSDTLESKPWIAA